MSKIISVPGIEVKQKNFHQIIIRGDGSEKFYSIIEEKTSIKPPSKNLEIKYDSNYLFGKNSPDQWSLVLTDKKDHIQILNLVSSININEELLASDYSYGQVYFEVEGDNKDKFLNKGIIPVISSSDLIKQLQDKRLTNIFFEKNNIYYAKEYQKDDFNYPIFIKPISGSRSLNNYLIRNKDEIHRKFLEDDNLLFFEYIDQSENDEYTCDLYYGKDSMLKCVVPRKRIEVRDGEVDKGMTKKNILVEFISKRLSYINGARGCLTAQFFVNKKTKKIIGIEINPRFGGGYPLTYFSGANYSKWILEEYLLKKEIQIFDDWKENLLMLRYSKEIIVQI